MTHFSSLGRYRQLSGSLKMIYVFFLKTYREKYTYPSSNYHHIAKLSFVSISPINYQNSVNAPLKTNKKPKISLKFGKLKNKRKKIKK